MSFSRCPITNLSISTPEFNSGTYHYEIMLADKLIGINLPADYADWNKDAEYLNNKHIVTGLLLNEQLFAFPPPYQYYTLKLEHIKHKLAETTYPVTPQEKYDNLFNTLFSIQSFDGEIINVSGYIDVNLFYKQTYFKSLGELNFYIRSIAKDGLVDLDFNEAFERIDKFSITYEGLSYALKLANEGALSKKCFIAMSFGKEMGDIRAAIKAACVETGFDPVLIDEVQVDSDSTINDAIIANLRKSRFCIADFTEQKMGVYFESGFALGQGKQVLYTCRKDHFDKSHFDTNHFPHLLYDTPEELRKALIDKIQAWVR